MSTKASTRRVGSATYYNSGETDGIYGVPPAAGFDFLGDGLGSFIYAVNNGGPRADPVNRVEIDQCSAGSGRMAPHRRLQGSGYETEGAVTLDGRSPVTPSHPSVWSEVNNARDGANSGGNHRIIPTAPPFSLQPGEARTFDIAFLFAQGTSNLDSITELRAASDRVQTAYDDGSLFDTRLPVATEVSAADPSTLRLDPVYPNPVRERATVRYATSTAATVLLSIYDVLGRRVAVLADASMTAGEHAVPFDAAGLPSGVYLVVLEADGRRETRKVMLMR